MEEVPLSLEENVSPTCSPPSKLIEGIDSLESIRAKGGLSPTQPDIQGSSSLTFYGFHLYDTETEVKLSSGIRHVSYCLYYFLKV